MKPRLVLLCALALAPGVYYVREAQAQVQALAIRKVVLVE